MTTPPHIQKLKLITLEIGSTEVQAQVSTWNLENNSDDGEQLWGYDGAPTREEADPDYALSLTFYSDWRSGGLSDFLVENDGEDAAFTLDHRPDVPAEHVTWTGTVRVKAPNAGGDVRSTETQDVTLQCIGKPVYARETP